MAKRRANGEGSIYKRQDGTWTAQYTDFSGKKRYLYGKTQQAVKDKLKKAIQENDDGILADAGRITFAAWAAEWFEVYAKPVIRPRTQRLYYNEIYLHIIPAFPGVLLKDVREDMLQKFINEKQEKRIDGKPGGYSVTLVSDFKVRLYSMMEKAVDLGLIAKNPAKKLQLKKEPSKEKIVFTKDQQQRLEGVVTDNLERDMSLAIILVMLNTGLRVGEASGLQIPDVDFERHEISVKRTFGRLPAVDGKKGELASSVPKTYKSIRVVPMSPYVEELMKKVMVDRERRITDFSDVWAKFSPHDRMGIDGGYVFLNSRFGNVVDNSHVGKVLRKFEREAGVPLVSPHGLRHTFATRWVEAGLDIKTLSEILGHTSTQLTLNLYTHSLEDQRRDGMAKFNEIYRSTDEQEEDNPTDV